MRHRVIMSGFGKDGKGQILWDVVTLTLGTLASQDVISVGSVTGLNLREDFRILKTQYFIHFAPGAFDALEGPLLVGMAAGGLTAALIEEAIESTPNDRNDYPEIEEVMRPIWPLDSLFLSVDTTNNASTGNRLVAVDEFNPRWTMPSPDGWVWWAMNRSAGALSDLGTLIITAKHFGVWVV